MNFRLMIVAHDNDILESLTCGLGMKKEWQIENFTDAREALQRAGARSFELFVADYSMPEMNGVEFLKKTKEMHPDSIRVLLGQHTNLEILMAAINQADVYRFICKPWNHHDLIATIEHALQHYNILAENRRLTDQVRQQQIELARRKLAIDKLSKYSDSLFNVNWSDDGSIELDDAELSTLEFGQSGD